ncbi:MAG: hypothetical protein RLZZ308_292 [Candidatus Parcubacteria bacterium]|jgi:catechol 2,3-dioxygenase
MKIQELGHVVLYVRDITSSAHFYRDILGYNEIHRDQGIALFGGSRTHHELLLIEVGGEVERQSAFRPKPGLYHIGFKVGDGHDAIVSVWHELKQKGVSILGSADHTITHSLYILDPDGNELELYADVSEEWKTDPLAILRPVRPLILE